MASSAAQRLSQRMNSWNGWTLATDGLLERMNFWSEWTSGRRPARAVERSPARQTACSPPMAPLQSFRPAANHPESYVWPLLLHSTRFLWNASTLSALVLMPDQRSGLRQQFSKCKV